MKRTLKRVSPLQLGKMLGLLYAFFGLIFLPFAIVFTLLAPHATNSPGNALIGGGVALALGMLMPVLYGIFGFVGGVIGALVYNVVASIVGGIEVEVE